MSLQYELACNMFALSDRPSGSMSCDLLSHVRQFTTINFSKALCKNNVTVLLSISLCGTAVTIY